MTVSIELHEKNNGCTTCDLHDPDNVICRAKHQRWRHMDGADRLVMVEIKGCADWSPAKKYEQKAA